MSEQSETEIPRPRPWWIGIAEKATSAAIIIGVGGPVMLATDNQYTAIGAGMLALLLTNLAYWKLIKGVPLSEVYDGLKPWV
jgi:hypothetical protein